MVSSWKHQNLLRRWPSPQIPILLKQQRHLTMNVQGQNTQNADKAATPKYLPSRCLPLLHYISRRSNGHGCDGYVYESAENICKNLKVSYSKVKRDERTLIELGLIHVEMYGKRRVIWTHKNYLNKDFFLSKRHPSTIGMVAIETLEEYSDPNATKILAQSNLISSPLFFSSSEPHCEPQSEPHDEPHCEPHPPHPLYNDKINKISRISMKEEVVSNIGHSATPSTPIPKATPPSPRAPRSDIPPLFQRDEGKEHISPEGMTKLLNSYDRELVEKKVRNATACIKKISDDGKFHSKFYQMGVDGLALMWCEEAKRQKDARVENKVRDEEPKREKSIEDVMAIRKKKVMGHPLMMQFGKMDGGGIIIQEDKIGSLSWNNLSCTGISFANEEFDDRFDKLSRDLERESRERTRRKFI